MSTSPPKNSSKGAPEGSQLPSRQLVLKGLKSKLVSKFSRFGGRKGKPGESNSSTDVSKKEVPSQSPDGKTVFKPKDLTICWQEESQYWSIPKGDDGPAELLEVCWLDVSGEMPVTKGKAYEVSFMLSMNTKNSFGWDDPVMVMAKIGEEREYERKEIDLSKLGGEVVEFPPDKCRVEPRGISSESDEKSESKEEPREKKSQTNKKGDENAKNDKEKLYFGLYEVWTNNWKGGLWIHEAIVQEIPAGINDPPPNTPSDDSKVQEVTADKSTSASENPPDKSIIKRVPDPHDEFVAQKTSVHEAIVQEIPAGINDPPPNTPSVESRGKEIAAHDD